MQKRDLLDLMAFTDHAWDQFRTAAPDDAELQRVAPGSGWPTLRDCLGHMVLAHERWVPAIVELRTGHLPELGDGDFASWAQIDAHRDRIRTVLRQNVEGWSDEELNLQHDVHVYGDVIRYSRAELVLHLLMHERGHHGDVTTLFWQLGIEAETAIEYRFHLGREG